MKKSIRNLLVLLGVIICFNVSYEVFETNPKRGALGVGLTAACGLYALFQINRKKKDEVDESDED